MTRRNRQRFARLQCNLIGLERLERRDLMSGTPVAVAPPEYQGLAVNRPSDADGPLYDKQPVALYDPTDTLDANNNGIPDRLYKLSWYGRYAIGDPDLAPADFIPGDRIYMSFSENGSTWSSPQVVLKGSGGTNGAISADDHLIGSPSIIKLGSKYHMFYEAYSTWATPLNRFYSFNRGDSWITNDQDLPVPGNAEGYAFERNMGFAPWFQKAGTHPVYSGEVIYNLSGTPKYNRYLSKTEPFVGTRDGATWSERHLGRPVYWLYDDPGPGRKPIYSFWDGAHSNTFATDSPTGDGVPNAQLVELLGYAAESLDSPDMVGAMQNRVMMATSTDAVNWTRFQGPGRGGAIIVPQSENTTTYNPQTWKLEAAYGSGYPSALVRDGFLELYFTDYVSAAQPYEPRRIRMPVDQIETPSAWQTARAPGNSSLSQFAGSGGDIKWSPLHRRYFATYFRTHTPQLPSDDPNFRQSATIIWSAEDPNPELPPEFAPGTDEIVLPMGGRNGEWGGILADGLGHTLDRTDGNDPRTDFDVFFASYAYGSGDIWGSEIGHATVTLRNSNTTGPATFDANGTSGEDAFLLSYSGNTADSTVSISVSSDGAAPQNLGTFPVSTKLRLNGFGGTDSVRIVGEADTDKYTVSSSTGLTFNDHRIVLNSIESRTLAGAAGNDVYKFDTDIDLGLWRLVESVGGTDTLDLSATTTLGVAVNISTSDTQVVNSNLSLKLGSGLQFERIIGGSKNDTLTGNSLANTLAGNAGNDILNGELGRDFLVGGRGNDRYVFGGATAGGELDTITEAPNLDRDTLDFSSRSVAVTVNISDSTKAQQVHTDRMLKLSSGLGIEIVLGGSGNDKLIGSSIANVLVGNGGNDTLIGSKGRDILIGGRGLDRISGGDDDDIVIAGRTTSDTSPANLATILTGWQTTASYSTRVAVLRAGVGSPKVSLTKKTNVLNDSGHDDELSGGAGTDWFFRATDDVISDLVNGELIDLL